MNLNLSRISELKSILEKNVKYYSVAQSFDILFSNYVITDLFLESHIVGSSLGFDQTEHFLNLIIEKNLFLGSPHGFLLYVLQVYLTFYHEKHLLGRGVGYLNVLSQFI